MFLLLTAMRVLRSDNVQGTTSINHISYHIFSTYHQFVTAYRSGEVTFEFYCDDWAKLSESLIQALARKSVTLYGEREAHGSLLLAQV